MSTQILVKFYAKYPKGHWSRHLLAEPYKSGVSGQSFTHSWDEGSA